jgi:hypothetical protein
MAQASYTGPPDALTQYELIVATVDGLSRKGAANPYTSRNGWMTSFLDKEGSMGLRLGTADRDEFLTTFGTSIAQQYGSNMPEFAVVPPAVFEDLDAIAPWFARSWDWVGTLQPKPTKK